MFKSSISIILIFSFNWSLNYKNLSKSQFLWHAACAESCIPICCTIFDLYEKIRKYFLGQPVHYLYTKFLFPAVYTVQYSDFFRRGRG